MNELRLRGLPKSERGQILVVFALGIVALLAVTALAVDVSNTYAARRFYRAVADAAALAGAQDLQTNTRSVTTENRTSARTDAGKVLKDKLGATDDPSCSGVRTDYKTDVTGCDLPGTPYKVSIHALATSTTCVTCDTSRAVQVTIDNPTFSLSFARILGFQTFNVGISSVAGLTFQSKYALITLRPSNILHSGLDQNRDDINLSGTNSQVNIIHGDVGTNTYVVTNSASMLMLADGYLIEHVDVIDPDGWNKDLSGNPKGKLIPPQIPDPNYTYPDRPTASSMIYASQSAGQDGSVTSTSTCSGAPTGELPVGTQCYKPGDYQNSFSISGSGPGAFLESGVYFFDQGLTIGSGQSLWGGLTSGQRGVAIVVPQNMTGSNKGFDGSSAYKIILNRGDASCLADTCRALPALDVNNHEIKTPDGLDLTIMVQRDSSCFVGTTPILCSDNHNNAVKLAGNSTMLVAGVIYGPSDRVNINANFTDQAGVVGQIISWTVDYAGGSTLNQDYPGGDEIGIVRLDAACTAPSTPCNP